MPLPLIVHAVSKRYVAGIGPCHASILALQRASLVVRPSEVVGVVGAAGAGKSTLMLCAAGLLRPDAGDVWWFERYQSIALCANLVQFVTDGPDAARTIELAAAYGARLIVVDSRAGDPNPAVSPRLGRALQCVTQRGGAVLLSARSRDLVARMCSRIVELESGCTAPDADALAVRPPARVAEEPPSRLVDPPFGWV